jgi:hypothetical protein
MIRSIATTLLNRLALLAVIMLIANAYTQTSCPYGDNPFTPIAKAMSRLNEIATALQKL